MIKFKHLLPLSILASVAIQPTYANITIKEVILEDHNGNAQGQYSPFRTLTSPMASPYNEIPAGSFSSNNQNPTMYGTIPGTKVSVSYPTPQLLPAPLTPPPSMTPPPGMPPIMTNMPPMAPTMPGMPPMMTNMPPMPGMSPQENCSNPSLPTYMPYGPSQGIDIMNLVNNPNYKLKGFTLNYGAYEPGLNN